MKYANFILALSIGILKLSSQCQIDSSVVNYYTAMSIHDNNVYKSIDSTILFDKPNSIWIDKYQDGLIQKRSIPISIWSNNETVFKYKEERIIEIQKLTRGFESKMVFEYQNDQIIRIEEIPKYFESTSYNVVSTENGYKLNFEKEGNQHWYEINTGLLKKCGGFEYGNLSILDCMLSLNITNSSSDIKNEEYFENWPDNEYYIITCKRDECGNVTLYSEQSRETLSIIELFEIKYTYK